VSYYQYIGKAIPFKNLRKELQRTKERLYSRLANLRCLSQPWILIRLARNIRTREREISEIANCFRRWLTVWSWNGVVIVMIRWSNAYLSHYIVSICESLNIAFHREKLIKELRLTGVNELRQSKSQKWRWRWTIVFSYFLTKTNRIRRRFHLGNSTPG